MSATFATYGVNPLSFSSENCLFSPEFPRSFKQQMSFSPRTLNKTTVKAYAESTSVMEPRISATTNLYEILRVNQNASPMEIKIAYRSLAKVYHPDATESDGRDFMELSNAYATLSDPSARALYDLSLRGVVGAADVRPFRYKSAPGSRWRGYTTRRWETDQCW